MMLNLLTTIWFWLAFATSPNAAAGEPDNFVMFELIAQKCSIDINDELVNSALSWCLINVLLNQGKQCIVDSFIVYHYGEGQTTEEYTTLTPDNFESVDQYTNDHCSLDSTQHEQLSCILDELPELSCADEPTEPLMIVPGTQSEVQETSQYNTVKANGGGDTQAPILTGLNEFIGQTQEKAGAGIIQPTCILALTLLRMIVDLI